MTEVDYDFESDAFLSLLTEALRSGPGSPSWHEALQRLRAGGIEYSDEHRLLLTAREHLESGKGYRSVRAGPAFTQRLMEAIESEPAARPRTPVATTIAVASAGVMVAVLLFIGYLLFTASNKTPGGDGASLLVNTVTSANFNPLAPDWRPIGQLPLDFGRGGMRLKAQAESSASGGGAVWSQPIPADEPFAVVVGVRVGEVDPDLIAQIFISDDPQFAPDSATTPHELVWLLQGNQAQVILPTGRVEVQNELPGGFRGWINVRITIDRDKATIEMRDRQLWAGAHQLDPAKPRHVGVRFLKRGPGAGNNVSFQAARVNMRQK